MGPMTPSSEARTLKPVSLDVSLSHIAAYAEITRDWNPIHLDEEFAKSTPMGGIIAHGSMSLNMIWQSLALSLGADALPRITLDARFLKPVRPGDQVQAGGEWSAEFGGWNVWVKNGSEEMVIAGTALMEGA